MQERESRATGPWGPKERERLDHTRELSGVVGVDSGSCVREMCFGVVTTGAKHDIYIYIFIYIYRVFRLIGWFFEQLFGGSFKHQLFPWFFLLNSGPNFANAALVCFVYKPGVYQHRQHATTTTTNNHHTRTHIPQQQITLQGAQTAHILSVCLFIPANMAEEEVAALLALTTKAACAKHTTSGRLWQNEVNKVLTERFAGQAKNEMEMKAAVYTAWTQVDQNAVKRSIASWPKRLLLCNEKEGGCFEYARVRRAL